MVVAAKPASVPARAQNAVCRATVVAIHAAPPGSRGLAADHWLGRTGLWVDLNPGGIAVYPHAVMLDNGSIESKAMWWRDNSATGPLKLGARRLDGRGAFRAQVPRGSGLRGAQPSGLIFSSPGCWRVTGHAGSATLSFVVSVRRS